MVRAIGADRRGRAFPAAGEHGRRPAHVLAHRDRFARLWQLHRHRGGVLGYAAIVVALGAGIFAAFQWLPTYTQPGPLGITRPALILPPLLWAIVGGVSWRLARLGSPVVATGLAGHHAAARQRG